MKRRELPGRVQDLAGRHEAKRRLERTGEANVTVSVVEKLAGIFKCGWQDIIGEIEHTGPFARKIKAVRRVF